MCCAGSFKFVRFAARGLLVIVPAIEAKFRNPVIASDFPDPFIRKFDGLWYAYATNIPGYHVPVATSDNLADWRLVGDALPRLPRWANRAGPFVWAPEVTEVNGRYLLFYTARHRASDLQCIGLAFSDSPVGPFHDPHDRPFILQAEEGGSIDASPFRDADGALYLYWKNDGNRFRTQTYLYGQRLSDDGTTRIGEPVRMLGHGRPWHGRLVEAPCMWQRDGRYYLFYSANGYRSSHYAVGYALCDTPLGPCVDAPENPILASDMSRLPLVVGPGHLTVFNDDEGESWVVYHVWDCAASGRRLDRRVVWLDRLLWRDGLPVIHGPTRAAQPAPVTLGVLPAPVAIPCSSVFIAQESP
jgi:beta-xylosidase